MKYDVIIVGAGPAGIFSALELTEKNNLNVLILDRGLDIPDRKCPSSRGFDCVHCEPCSVLSGWGGAGAYSDGKLTLSTEVGGWLNQYLSRKDLEKLVKYVDSIYLRYGASEQVYGCDIEKVDEIERKASLAGLKLIRQEVRHMGTDKCLETLKRMREELNGKVTFFPKTDVKDLIAEDHKIKGVKTSDGEIYLAKYVIIAPGRSGAEWLQTEAQFLGLKTVNNPVDVGVRVEVLASVMDKLTKALYEPKLIYFSKQFDDQVRTFCVSPYGEVTTESYDGVLTVNGQSYAERKTENTNFALLVSTSFTEPFKEPIAYGKYVARLSNLLSGGVMVQRLGDLVSGRRSTPERISRSVVTPTLKNATPGDLSFVLPYRYLSDIREMLQALDVIVPGVHSRDTLLYGIEVKFYSSHLQLNNNLETKIQNMFTIGDGAGVTRGLIQASASGVIVAREILKREQIKA
ncbi:NAD(P)/FAD-dependent oxidoreductase [Candidatus Bathyarchaeota archaeon]|nr:MAG: FAD-dependent oxidoreductase [miscellaneous Crenarchaeota group-6 archaeon AD8-1]TRO49252.1 NAD(P)/FAD-dependent oxidoreductase [Candidatus Bathyarchaeota archaeon]